MSKPTMREVRSQWVEFMSTFEGRGKTREFEDLFDAMLDEHNRGVAVSALGGAKMTLPLENLASVRFIASDGIPSIGMNTNDEAKDQVLKGLDDLIGQFRRGEGS